MNAAMKVIGGVIILFAIIIAVFSYKDVLPFLSGTTTERLESIWKRDTMNLMGENLKGNKVMHDGFLDVKDVNMTYGSKTAESWFKDLEVPYIKKNPNGKFRLEVFTDHWSEGKEYGAVIQYQLVDLASQDTVWELGRTFTLGERDDLVPEKVKPETTTAQTPSPNK